MDHPGILKAVAFPTGRGGRWGGLLRAPTSVQLGSNLRLEPLPGFVAEIHSEDPRLVGAKLPFLGNDTFCNKRTDLTNQPANSQTTTNVRGDCEPLRSHMHTPLDYSFIKFYEYNMLPFETQVSTSLDSSIVSYCCRFQALLLQFTE